MSEYVGYYKIDEFGCDILGNLLKHPYLTDEPIVRCRDCKKRDIDLTAEKVCPMDGYDPDGFCKWGELNND